MQTVESPTGEGDASVAASDSPRVVLLEQRAAADASLTGAKAANLARARQRGHPVLPGLLVTTAATPAVAAQGRVPDDLEAEIHAQLDALGWPARPLVARSSSTAEDVGESSMAGQFESVLDLRDRDALADAVVKVVGSAAREGLGDQPIAVLVQPFLPAERSGVLFGADPVRHDADHIVVAATDEGPDALVSGTVAGETTVLTPKGKHAGGAHLDRSTRRRLAKLARALDHDLGGPQDVEWAIDHDDDLHLLQARPITTPVHHGEGPRFGTGPVAETFPVPLAPLERDLWIEPLRAGLVEALQVSGTASSGSLKRSPVVISVDGNVAVDLDLLEPALRRGLRRLDPRPPARRLTAAWRVGRLRSSLPALASDLVREVDTDLAEVPSFEQLSDRQLAGVVERAGLALGALHGYEVLAGLLLDVENAETTGAAVALRALAEGRRLGESDEQIVASRPVVLALLPPSVGAPAALPATPTDPEDRPEPVPEDEDVPPSALVSDPGEDGGLSDLQRAALAREALRVRVRWVQELQARAAWELGGRLADHEQLTEQRLVRWLRRDELLQMVDGARAPADLAARQESSTAGGALPASFHLSSDGAVVTDLTADTEGQGAGGGRGSGPVHVGTDTDPEQGDVLVVRTLDPDLAPLLPRLAGLVAETGSPLSHLAILAREHDVPTVVARSGATTELQDGQVVTVDGESGEVRPADPSTAPGDASPSDEQTSDPEEATP